ncbi:recombinase family protein [Brachybacterium paraconglomeratum]|uniref:recombinase family protein n=1 Tax=Brachybacterium paraconglomeratum TaxID=173362 RepID=UPI00223B1CC1|nr:recombinase family protein [Brachybacterium paraconglomeratum]MCT1438591.1 recombinase family protein [Brachybacterium paraconglomeratum]
MTGTHRAPGRRVAYLRVSSASQNLARQLEAVGECDQVFTEKQSGKSATDRPQLQALIRHVRRGDHVVVASMDRLARSVIDLNDIVQQITGDPAEHTEQHPRKGASIEFLKERLTFEPGHADAMAAFQLNMMGAFAQFERELIRQRQAEGIAVAKKRGAYKGRPRSLEGDQIRSVRNAALGGTPKVQIAREHGISRSTLYRYLQPTQLPLD